MLLLVLVPLAVVVAGCASSSHAPKQAAGAATPGTATIRFHAYTAGGQLAVQAGPAVRGQCWTTSIAAPGATAYRCFQGNKILDPCFAPTGAQNPTVLACLPAPWGSALMLRVSGKLPAPSTAQLPARPWAIQLSSGMRCVASTGTVPAVAGVNLTYHCADGGNASLGDVSGGTLTAQYAAAEATTLTNMTVTTVWDA